MRVSLSTFCCRRQTLLIQVETQPPKPRKGADKFQKESKNAGSNTSHPQSHQSSPRESKNRQGNPTRPDDTGVPPPPPARSRWSRIGGRQTASRSRRRDTSAAASRNWPPARGRRGRRRGSYLLRRSVNNLFKRWRWCGRGRARRAGSTKKSCWKREGKEKKRKG